MKLSLLLFAALCAVVSAQTAEEQNLLRKLQQAQELLQSGACKHVYLDVGTNRGVQLRKLFEPHHYPLSAQKILKKFETHFGSSRDNVCAFGFEPNLVHQEWLESLEAIYRKRGHKVLIFTTTAVSTNGGTATFYRDIGKHKEEVGASLVPWKGESAPSFTVALLDLAEFINNYVMRRANQQPDSKVLLKMDIEGAEYDVVPHLLAHGAMCRLNEAMVEWHQRKVPGVSSSFPEYVADFLKRAQRCHCVFGAFDDETYALDKRPLPTLRRD